MADQHRDHDLGPVVAFADGELAGAELDAVAAQVESCAACADLVADLVALTVADRSMATPIRSRDFRLTAADATRLSAIPTEPVGAAPRLATDMTTLSGALRDHPTHDPLLIAAAVDGGLEGPDRARADSWLSGCSACADLHGDLLAIAAANRALPTPARPADYRLTPEAAERARGRGLRGFLARMGSPRDGFTRPLAAGLTTLGLAGLILTSGSSLLPMSSAGSDGTILSTVGAALPEQNSKSGDQRLVTQPTDMPGVFSGQGESAGSAAASALPAAAEAAPLASMAAPAPDDQAAMEVTDGSGLADGDPSLEAPGAAVEAPQAGAGTAVEAPPAEGPATASVVSLVLLLMGLGLFAGRWFARRRVAG